MLAAMRQEESKFHNVLKSLRVRRGIGTHEQAAELLGVKTRLYRGWEYGEFIPSAKQLKLIATTFALSQEDEDMLYRAAAQALPTIKHLPFDRNPLFTGREAQLAQLRQYLQDCGSNALTQPVAICGLAGIGKTQLALEYAYRSYPKVYRAVLWVSAADEATLKASYGDLANVLGLPEQDEQELDTRVHAVKQWLEDHTNWLLILDNADNLQLARSFFPKADHARILLTTRSQIVGDTVARQIDLDRMVPNEGLLFLLKRAFKNEGETTIDAFPADIRAEASQVVELLGGHPLALDQAGAYIEDGGSFTGFIQDYHVQRRELLHERGSLYEENNGKHSDYPDTVAVTFELCFEKARARHPLTLDLLHFCAFLQPDAIPYELFKHDDSFRLDTTAFRKGMAALLRYSLLKRNDQENTFSMHRLVQALAIDALSHDLQVQWRERVVRVVSAAFPDFPEDNYYFGSVIGQCRRLMSHVFTCAAWTDDELAQTVEVAKLLHRASIYLHNRYQLSDAEPLLERVLSIYKQHLGVVHIITASDLISLADLCKYDQAEALYQQALAVGEKHLGVEHPETALIMHCLARLYMDQDKYEHAEPLLKQVLSFREEHLGVEHPDTLSCLHDLASLYSDQRNYEQAEDLYRRSLAIREEHLGADHPDIAVALGYLADFYMDHFKYEQAAPLLQRAVAIMEKHLGAEHPDIALPLFVLAFLVHDQGEHEKAEALYQRALSIHEQGIKASPHPNAQSTFRAYANFLHRIDLIDEYMDAVARKIDMAMSW